MNLVERGTLPIDNKFWNCGQGTVLWQTLTPYWGGVCATVILIDSLRILLLGIDKGPTEPLGKDKRTVVPRRKTRFSAKEKRYT